MFFGVVKSNLLSAKWDKKKRRIQTIRGKEQGRIGQLGNTFSYKHQ